MSQLNMLQRDFMRYFLRDVEVLFTFNILLYKLSDKINRH